MYGRLARDNILSIVGEAWRIAIFRVDILQRDRKVHNVQIEVIDAPILELLLADGLDSVMVMVSVPELRYEEEVFALYKAILNGAGNALAGFLLIAVVYTPSDSHSQTNEMGQNIPQAPSKRR